MAGPSRRCTWKSSGCRSVMRSIASILLGPVECPAIELGLGHAGDARGQLGGLARRQGREEDLEHALGVDCGGGTLFARREHQDEFALRSLATLVEPARRSAERH